MDSNNITADNSTLKDLLRYANTNGIDLSAVPPCPRAQRLQAICNNPESAELWWDFLVAEENMHGTSKPPSASNLPLLAVYRCAVGVIPRQKYYDNDIFVRVWVGYARQQWWKNPDDARDAFKALRSQHIGDRSALLYCEWASLEACFGSVSKALSIVEKGERAGASPAGVLQALRDEISSGSFLYAPFWKRPLLNNTATPPQRTEAMAALEECITTSAMKGNLTGMLSGKAFTNAGSSSDDATASSLHSISLTGQLVSNIENTTTSRQLNEIKDAALPQATAPRAVGEGSALKARKFGMFGKAVRVASISLDSTKDTSTEQPDNTLDSELRKRKADPTMQPQIDANVDGKRKAQEPLSMQSNILETQQQSLPTAGVERPLRLGLEPASNLSLVQRMKALEPIPETNALGSAGGSVPEGHQPQLVLGDPSSKAEEDETVPLPSIIKAPQPGLAGGNKIVVGKDGSIVRGPSLGPSSSDYDVSNEATAPLPPRSTQGIKPMATPVSSAVPNRLTMNSVEKARMQLGSAAKAQNSGMKASSASLSHVPGSSRAVRQQQHDISNHRRVIEDENSIVVRNISYTKLECVGRGGSSKVYKVMAPNKKIFALKRIRLNGRDAEAASGFLDEITLLNKLKGKSNIIQLVDAEVHQNEGIIYMVLEYGDIDLARLLQRHGKTRSEAGINDGSGAVDENFIRLYWDQMLFAVHTIHEERIVHSDLKPANFLIVEGQLKLIDFGIAKAIQSDTTSIARESQVGTLNYMSPEAILGGNAGAHGGAPMKVGRASDIWSLGCILYQMVYGHTPFSALPFIQKMQAIINPKHQITFPPIKNDALVDVMQRCLDRNPKTRITMKELREHSFLRPTEKPARGGPAQGDVKLSKEQLQRLLMKVSQASGGNAIDMQQLSEQLYQQMVDGLSPEIVRKQSSRTNSNVEEQKFIPVGNPAAGGQSRMPLMPVKDNASLADILAGKPKEEELDAALREGLERFNFNEPTQ